MISHILILLLFLERFSSEDILLHCDRFGEYCNKLFYLKLTLLQISRGDGVETRRVILSL